MWSSTARPGPTSTAPRPTRLERCESTTPAPRCSPALPAASGRRSSTSRQTFVFDGHKRSPYVESDGANALQAYGRSKQAGETAVAVANRRHFIVRTAWLFGNRGKNFVETMLRVGSEQAEILVVSDQHGCPTYTRHLAAALAELAESEAFGVHHIAGGGSASWYEFAEEIFDQSGVECRVIAATSEMVPRPARRPRRGVLGTERRDALRLAPWQDGLASYLAERERVRPPIGAGSGR